MYIVIFHIDLFNFLTEGEQQRQPQDQQQQQPEVQPQQQHVDQQQQVDQPKKQDNVEEENVNIEGINTYEFSFEYI